MILPSKEFWEQFKATNGALSVTEAIAIMNLADMAPRGRYLECGTFHGKSAMAALIGLKDYEGNDMVDFILVDPIFENHEVVKQVMENISVCDKNMGYAFESSYSTDEIPKHDDYCYCMIDSGSHQDGLPMQEARLLEDRMVQGGIMVWHDWNSQFKEVKEATDYLVGTGKYEYVPINWNEIVEYVRENDLESGNQSWHHSELDFPQFVGAVRKL